MLHKMVGTEALTVRLNSDVCVGSEVTKHVSVFLLIIPGKS